MGNPFVDIEISINNDEFLWSHGLISDETYQLTQSICNNSKQKISTESKSFIHHKNNLKLRLISHYVVALVSTTVVAIAHISSGLISVVVR